jgi:hypothetical protein
MQIMSRTNTVRLIAKRLFLSKWLFIKVYNALQSQASNKDRDALNFGSLGVTVFHDFLTNRECSDVISLASEWLGRYDKVITESCVNEWCINDKESGLQFWTSTLTNDVNYFGRRRVFLVPQSVAFKSLVSFINQKQQKLIDFGRRYYSSNITLSGILVERLTPSIESDHWHIDRTSEGFKAMIILKDVKMENGPLRYKTQTQGTKSFLKKKLLFETHKYGLDFAYPPFPAVNRSPEETFYGVGKAGSCIVFNTLGIHSGTRCLSGERLAIVFYFDVQSKLNRFIRYLDSC